VEIVPVGAPSLVRAIALSATLVFADALFLNQGAVSFLVGSGLLAIYLPRTFLRRFAPVRRQRFRNLGVYLGAVVAVFALNYANNRIAEQRANALVSAVNAFHAKHARYPGSLEELVPGFIDRVPVAKYTLGLNRCSYFAQEGDARLSYVVFPPYGHAIYRFSRGTWGYLD
jgi:hypothetical protein